MGIILIIMQIISAIPTLISVVKEILGLIRSLPHGEQAAAYDKLLTVAKNAKADRLVSPDQAKELHGFLEYLRAHRRV